MSKSLEEEFELAMRNIYDECSSFNYRPIYLLEMIAARGGVGAAKALMARAPSEGYTRLALEGRLDLAVESLVEDPRWSDLFTENEKAVARSRLR